MTPLVVHCKEEKFDVFIGRPSKWGNPYSRHPDNPAFLVASREEAIAKYEEWLRANPQLVEDAKRELRGKRLGCFCAPLACHGDVLVRIANAEAPQSIIKPSTYDPVAYGARCDICPAKDRVVVPPTWANGKPRLVIVGEKPGRRELFVGRSFVGPSGKLLDRALRDAGIDRDACHVTNACLCVPKYEHEEALATACCAPRLAAEVAPLDAPIVALGKEAARSVLGVKSILLARGFVWKAQEIDEKKLKAAAKKAADDGDGSLAAINDLHLEARRHYAGKTVLPTLHPAFILRAPTWGPVLALDMRRAARVAEAHPHPIPLADDGYYSVVGDAKGLEQALSSFGPTVATDVETDGVDPLKCKLLCVGISDGKRTVVAYPYRRAMGEVIRNAFAERTVVTHNGPAFDHLVLQRYGITVNKWEDTLLAHHAFASHLPQRLDHVVSEYCDASPWKVKHGKRGAAEEKGASPWQLGGEELCLYNNKDVRLTIKAWFAMQPDLEVERSVYEFDKQMARLCQEMQRAGIRLDETRRVELSLALKRRAAGLLGDMRKRLNNPLFHPAKLGDVRKALFGRLKAPKLHLTESGLLSTSSATLEALKESESKAGMLAKLILEWRGVAKARSTFVEGVDPGRDHRVHASWRAHGTATGRPATRGPNLLNLPRYDAAHIEAHVRDMYVAKPGCEFVYFDLRQAEMHMAANVAGDEAFIATCQKDVHTGNALVLFPDAEERLTRDPKGKDCPVHGEGLKKAVCNCGKLFRDIAKNAGFAVTYYAMAETVFAFLRSQGFDVTMDAVDAMLRRMKQTYWRYFEFVEENIRFVAKHGFLRTPVLGRIRWLGQYASPSEVANTPVQAGVADIMGLRLQTLDTMKPSPRCRLIVYAYDAAIYECPKKEADAMDEAIVEVWKKPVTLTSNGRTWVQPIDRKRATRWSEL